MEDYNFWQDFFDTYQSLPDWLKFAWLVIPPGFVLGVLSLVLRYRISNKNIDREPIYKDLAYTIHHNSEDNRIQIFRYKGSGVPRDILLLEENLPNQVENSDSKHIE